MKYSSRAERTGARLAQAWLGVLRQERRITHWIIGNGVSPLAARSLVWVVKLVVLCALLYALAWLGLLLVLVVTGIWLLQYSEAPEPKPAEHRDGPLGFGLYDEHGCRIDLDNTEGR